MWRRVLPVGLVTSGLGGALGDVLSKGIGVAGHYVAGGLAGGAAAKALGGRFKDGFAGGLLGAAARHVMGEFSEVPAASEDPASVSAGEGTETEANRAALEKELDALRTDGTLGSSRTFETADAAASEVLSATAPLSQKYGLEIAGSIMKRESGYSYTFPKIGSEGSASISGKYIGYHTHPSGVLMFSNTTNNYRLRGGGDAGWVASTENALYLGVHTNRGVAIGVCEPGNCSKIGQHGTKPSRVLQPSKVPQL